jgi:hypothetical protein
VCFFENNIFFPCSLAQERATLVEDKAAQAQEEADEKKAKAEELLKTVDGLAGLAREAAAAAAAERAKAMAAHNAEVAKQNQAVMDTWMAQQQASLKNDGHKQVFLCVCFMYHIRLHDVHNLYVSSYTSCV